MKFITHKIYPDTILTLNSLIKNGAIQLLTVEGSSRGVSISA